MTFRTFSLERNRISRSLALDSRRNQHDPADGLAVLDTRLRFLLRSRRRLSRRHVLSRLVSIISSINVCSQRVQTHLSPARIRNGNHLGHASRHHRGRHFGYNYGIDNTFDIWIMVSKIVHLPDALTIHFHVPLIQVHVLGSRLRNSVSSGKCNYMISKSTNSHESDIHRPLTQQSPFHVCTTFRTQSRFHDLYRA